LGKLSYQHDWLQKYYVWILEKFLDEFGIEFFGNKKYSHIIDIIKEKDKDMW